MGFGDNRFPDRLDILPEDHNNVHYPLRGRSQSHVDQRVFGSGHWDPYHHHLGLGRGVPRAEHILSLTLVCLKLTNNDVSNFPDALHNLHTLSVAFNQITDVGLSDLLGLDPNVVTLDLEANEIVLAIWTQAVYQLCWADSPLRHLNVSHNTPTIESLICLCWGVGLSSLITLDAAMSDYPARHVPERLLTFILANKSLERVDLQGIRFCTMAQ